MSDRWRGDELMNPLSPDQPCGESLEDTALLASFDAYRLFGQAKPLDSPPEPGETRVPKPPGSPEWVEIRDKALEALSKSKDLRLLANLGTAVLRTDGLPAFSETLKVASHWLETYWSQAYPLVDEDAILRRNALNCFADQMAVLDGLRRLPLVRSREHGTFGLREIEIATGQMQPGPNDARPDYEQIKAAFAAMPLEDLTELNDSLGAAVAAAKSIDAKMRDSAGTEAAPGFEPLTAQFDKLVKAVRAQLALRPGHEDAAGTDGEGAAGAGGGVLGAIRSRQDAIRALDAVADFFRQTEPSSPIPMFLARAKRLVSKDFLEVLADIAPEALAQARAAGGLGQVQGEKQGE
jgi:type VI secretion system protein ImpA